MAERLIEFYTSWPTDKVVETLAELSAGRTWVTATSDQQNHVRILVDAAETGRPRRAWRPAGPCSCGAASRALVAWVLLKTTEA